MEKPIGRNWADKRPWIPQMYVRDDGILTPESCSDKQRHNARKTTSAIMRLLHLARFSKPQTWENLKSISNTRKQ